MTLPLMNPETLAQVQKTTMFIRGEMIVDYREDSITLKLSSTNFHARATIPKFLEQLSESLSQQLKVYFAMNGDIREIGKS